ncbi:MAG: 5-oxoprolinase subunit B family protein [Micromonosporaceae bacterium]
MGLSIAVHPYGDSALYVEVIEGTDEQAWRLTHALAQTLREQAPPGVLNTVPTYDTIFIEFDLAATSHARVHSRILDVFHAVRSEAGHTLASRRFVLPVVYGGDFGPDLVPVAQVLDMSTQALVERHTSHVHKIRCIAGPVGGPMMAAPQLPALVPRQSSPRARVPAGAILLAGRQGFVKTMDGPGGWQIIGRTPLQLISLDTDPLVPWRPGDDIRFDAIDESEWSRWEGRRPGADDG